MTTHSMFLSERGGTEENSKILELDNMASTNAHIASWTKQVELLVKSQTNGANALMASSVCDNCGANHVIKSCMLLASLEEQVNYIQNGSCNFNLHSFFSMVVEEKVGQTVCKVGRSFQKLHNDIPFANALAQMPNYK